MKQTLSFPLDADTIAVCGGWDGLRRTLAELGLDGIEGILGGGEIPADFPRDLLTGYHLTFFPDWLDFYRNDQKALTEKFGSLSAVRSFYGGLGPETLLNLYRADLERAEALGAQYVVFHVSDVSIEEGYTYSWLHRDEEVIDAAIEVINTLLDGKDWPFAFLVENQWWPGFSFTEPEKTARLLDGIHFPGKGILLDTGHLMNSNTALRTQGEGAAWIEAMLDRHGALSNQIRGIHLHQSLSGVYVEKHTGFLPSNLPEDYVERFRVNYSHILEIDRHQPWTDLAILPVLERIAPDWVTHELSGASWAEKIQAARIQTSLLQRGG